MANTSHTPGTTHPLVRKASAADMVAYYTECLAQRDSEAKTLKAQNAELVAALREVEEVLNVNPAATEHLSIAVARNVRAAIAAATGAK